MNGYLQRRHSNFREVDFASLRVQPLIVELVRLEKRYLYDERVGAN